MKPKLVRGYRYETYNTKEVKKDHKKEGKTEEEETAEEAPVPLVTHLNNVLHSIFLTVEVYINNQQIYNSNGLYAHKSYFSNNFKGAISEYKGVLHCEAYEYEDGFDEIMDPPMFEPFFTSRMIMLGRPDGFRLYGKLVVDLFSTFELLYPKMKIRLRLIRARPNFHMISDNPNVSLGIVDCSLYTRRFALKVYYHKKTNVHACLQSCGVQLIGDSGKYFHHTCQTKPVHSRTHFQQSSISSDCYCNELKICIHWVEY